MVIVNQLYPRIIHALLCKLRPRYLNKGELLVFRATSKVYNLVGRPR